MRPTVIILTISLLISLHIPVFAQDSDLIVIDPHQILSSSVQTVEQLPVININDKTRTLDYFDPKTTTWKIYSYPTDLKAIENVSYNTLKRSNGTYIISPKGFFSWFIQDFAPKRWVFDPTKGEFSPLQPVCINQVPALAGEGEWIIIDDKGSSYVCNTETGALSPPIPSVQEDGYCAGNFRQHSAVSPDKKYLLFFCGGLQFSAFSYNIQKQTFLALGKTTDDENENVDVIRWLNNSEAVIHSYPSWNPPSNSFFTVDVSTANSLQFITWGMYLAPLYIDTPPHLEWIPCEFGVCGGPSDDPPGLHYYDFISHKLTILPDLPTIDGVSVIIPNGGGDRLYRRLNYVTQNSTPYHYDKAPSATLVRFNYETEKQEEIFTGEIEWIEGFSPNGRYVVLQIGDNDEVASSALLAENQAGYMPRGRAHLTIIDLETNKVVYQATGNEWGSGMGFDPMPLSWIDNRTFRIQNINGNSDQIIQLDSTVKELAKFPPNSTQISPNGRFVLVSRDNYQLTIYDVLRDQFIPVIEQPVPRNLQIDSSWNDANSLLITISQDDMVLAQWIVNIN